MKRRDFLTRTALGVSASLLLGNVRSDGSSFIGSALAAGEGDRQKATLEQKFAEFALSIKYEGLPAEVIAAAKRVAKSVLVYRVASPQRAATLASLGATHVSLIGG